MAHKKKARTAGGKGAGSSAAKRPAGAPARTQAEKPAWWSIAATALGAVVAYVLLAPVLQPAPAVLLPLLVGAYVGLVVPRPVEAAATGAVSALLGGALSAWTYSAETAQGLLNAFPAWANIDVPGGTYTDGFIPLLRMSPWLTDSLGIVLLGIVVCGGTAGGIALMVRGGAEMPWLRAATGWGLVLLLAACFLTSAETGSAFMRGYANVEPANGEYRYDAVIYLKTFYLMEKGSGFYPAAVEACAGDARLKEGNAVRDGKMFGFWPKPSYFRQPLPFWLWSAAASDGAGVVRLAEALCAVLMLALYAAFGRWMSVRAALVPMLLFPWLVFHTLSLNVFFPDWWAALGSMFALALLAGGQRVGAIVAALVAALMRFDALPLLVALGGGSVLLLAVKAERKRALVLAGVAVAAGAVFAVAWQLHLRAATPFIDPGVMASTTDSGILSTTADRTFEARALAPLYYLMYPYGFGRLPLLALFPLALAGFTLALRGDRFAQLSGALFTLGWFVFLVAVGPASSYWGQAFTGALVVGFGALLAELPEAGTAWGELAARWREAWPKRAASMEAAA